MANQKDQQECCCTTGANIMILACSGGANVGQLTNQAAIELTKEGWGKMFCLAGVGAHLTGFVQSVKDNPDVVVLDGCEIGCSKAIFEHLNLPIRNYIVVTKDMQIEKNHEFDLKREEIDRLKEMVKTKVG